MAQAPGSRPAAQETIEAAELTGDNLKAACMSQPGSAGDLACNSFVAGFSSGASAQRPLQIQGYAMCAPRRM
jgi:hypothetical protein